MYPFTTRTRDDGETFVTKSDDLPDDDPMSDVIYRAHDGEPPNDWRYSTIQSIYGAIADDPDAEDYEIAGNLVDVYPADLFRWLSDFPSRAAYVDDAQAEGLVSKNATLVGRVRVGQFLAILPMVELIRYAMQERSDI